MGGTITSIQGGVIRQGRCIPVQATGEGKRKTIGLKGKAPISAGMLQLEKRYHNQYKIYLVIMYQASRKEISQSS